MNKHKHVKHPKRSYRWISKTHTAVY